MRTTKGKGFTKASEGGTGTEYKECRCNRTLEKKEVEYKVTCG